MTALEELMSAEAEKIEELRKRMANEMSPEMLEDTHMFYRFLKARDFNIDHSEYMLRNHLAWRKEFDVESILTKYKSKEVVAKYFPGCMIGLDKEGCTVRYFNLGNLDPKGIRRAAKFLPDMVKHVLFQMEEEMEIVKQQSKKLGKQVTGSVYILDLGNFSFSSATDKKMIAHAIYLAKMYQDNYPERLKSVFVINVSTFFSLFFNIVKVFLAASILKKSKFYSTDDYKQDLLKVIDADVLPAFLGGNRTDPDGNPLCITFVNHCGSVPEKYFVNKNSRMLAKVEGVKKLNVPRISVREIELKVDEIGSVIEWEFETKSRDIGFGLYYKEVDGGKDKVIELVALMRLDTDDFSETGIHKCEKPGTYIILFDNSYSWMRSKEIYYRIIIKNPDEYEKGLQEAI